MTRLQTHRHRATCQTLTASPDLISPEEAEKLSPEEIKAKMEDAQCRFHFPREPYHYTHLEHPFEVISRVPLPLQFPSPIHSPPPVPAFLMGPS